MKALVFLLLLLLVSSQISLGQETLDFSSAAHWTGAVVLDGNPANPIIVGNQILVVDDTHQVRRIDISDPYAPQILPSVPLGDGVSRIQGPFDGYFYASADLFLVVLEEETLEIVDVIWQPNVGHICIEDGLGAMLVNDGESIILFDPQHPLSFPTLGEFPLNLYFTGFDYLSFFGQYLLYSGLGAVVIDAGNPSSPVLLNAFGWNEESGGPGGTYYQYTKRAIITDAVYTTENYYELISAGQDEVIRRGYLTRWDFSDPENPVALERELLLNQSLAPYIAIDEDETMLVQGGRIVSAGTLSSNFGNGYSKVSVTPASHICGLASQDGIIVLAQTDGVVHLFKDQQQSGPDPVEITEGGIRSAAISPTRFMHTYEFGDQFDPYFTVKVFDTTDPRNPTQLMDYTHEQLWPQKCAVTTHCAVFCGEYSSAFSSFDLDDPGPPVQQGVANDFVFFDQTHGAAASDEGLRIFNTSNATSFVELSHPWAQPVIELSLVTGDSSMVAALDPDGTLRLWRHSNPSEPELVSTLSTDLDYLVEMTGGPQLLVAGIREGSDSWPGFELVVIDANDPYQPVVAAPLRLPGRAYGGALKGAALHLACGGAGMVVVDVMNPALLYIRGGLGTGMIQAATINEGTLLLGGTALSVLEPDIASPVELLVTDFELIEEYSGVELRWKLAPGSDEPQFRLRAENGINPRSLDIQKLGDFWVAKDSHSTWDATRYILEHRFDKQAPWMFTLDRTVVISEPARPRLLPAAPNPFNPQVTLVFELPRDEFLTVQIYDVAGHLIKTMVDEHRPMGLYQITWDGRDFTGRKMPSGTYFAQLVTESYTQTQKLQLVR